MSEMIELRKPSIRRHPMRLLLAALNRPAIVIEPAHCSACIGAPAPWCTKCGGKGLVLRIHVSPLMLAAIGASLALAGSLGAILFALAVLS